VAFGPCGFDSHLRHWFCGYVGLIVVRELATDDGHGSVVCKRGHTIEFVRESPAAALR
jgi:hypothetical protein